jgi:hypothetical protein
VKAGHRSSNLSHDCSCTHSRGSASSTRARVSIRAHLLFITSSLIGHLPASIDMASATSLQVSSAILTSWEFIRSISCHHDDPRDTGAYVVPQGMIALPLANRRSHVATYCIHGTDFGQILSASFHIFSQCLLSIFNPSFLPEKVIMQVIFQRNTNHLNGNGSRAPSPCTSCMTHNAFRSQRTLRLPCVPAMFF